MDRSPAVRNLLLLYYRYRGTAYYTVGISGIVMFVSFLLVIFVIIPQINHVLSVQREIESAEKNISVMEENQRYIASVGRSQEEEQTEVVLSALPLNRDYAGVYNAIVKASQESGVGLSDFQYQVGASEGAGEGNSVSGMRVGLSLTGGPQSVQSFMKSLQDTLPLSEVRLVSGDDSLANVEVYFFHGGEQIIQIDPKSPLSPLSSEKSQLLKELSAIRPVQGESSQPVTSSASAFSQSPF